MCFAQDLAINFESLHDAERMNDQRETGLFPRPNTIKGTPRKMIFKTDLTAHKLGLTFHSLHQTVFALVEFDEDGEIDDVTVRASKYRGGSFATSTFFTHVLRGGGRRRVAAR